MPAVPAQFADWSDQGDVIVFSLTKGCWKFQVGCAPFCFVDLLGYLLRIVSRVLLCLTILLRDNLSDFDLVNYIAFFSK
jgi:hypothetical protein